MDKGVPSWLLENEAYSPRSDRDAFIDRSILSFLGLLSRARTRGGKEEGRGTIDAFFKLIAVLLLLLLVSLTRSRTFLAVVGTFLLILLAAQRGERVATVLKTSLAVVLFTALILLPSALGGGTMPALVIVAKVFISVASVKLVSVSTEWASISGALRRLRIPDLFILVFDIALKYIALLGDFALSMLYALRLRSVGRNAGKRASLSGIAGTLFLKSKEMSEEMYAAMECRGFSGEYGSSRRLRFTAREGVLVAGMAALVCIFILLPGA
ncbi:MAG: energy-coupling factor transporter transmembrane component T [Rectinemataceae bacterium]|jgi:cobalt/nickel transport system permease protein